MASTDKGTSKPRKTKGNAVYPEEKQQQPDRFRVQFEVDENEAKKAKNAKNAKRPGATVVEIEDEMQQTSMSQFPNSKGAGDINDPKYNLGDDELLVLKSEDTLNDGSEEEEAPDVKIVDIDRLIYVPKHRKVEQEEGKLLYVVDYVVILMNFFTLLLSMYYMLVGMSILSFKSSIESILIDATTASQKTPTLLYTHGSSSPTSTAMILIMASIIQIINVMMGCFATVQGYRNLLLLHLGISVVFLFYEFISASIFMHGAFCKQSDLELTQERFIEYIRMYGTTAPQIDETDDTHQAATFQLDSIQHGLSCCGAISWADYLDSTVLIKTPGDELPTKLELDGVDMVFPASCCRPWWVRNVHCARGAHLWAHPSVNEETALKFRMRINQAGCMWRIKEGCFRLVFMTGQGLLYCAVIDVFLVIIKFVCESIIMRRIWAVIKQKKAEVSKDAVLLITEEEAVITDEEGNAIKTIPLPTEDEIELIKARSDFNKFETQIKRTKIGKWMRAVRKSVYVYTTDMQIRPVEDIEPDLPSSSVENKKKSQGVITPKKRSLQQSSDQLKRNSSSTLGRKAPALNMREVAVEDRDAEDVLKTEIRKQIKKHEDQQKKDAKRNVNIVYAKPAK